MTKKFMLFKHRVTLDTNKTNVSIQEVKTAFLELSKQLDFDVNTIAKQVTHISIGKKISGYQNELTYAVFHDTNGNTMTVCIHDSTHKHRIGDLMSIDNHE